MLTTDHLKRVYDLPARGDGVRILVDLNHDPARWKEFQAKTTPN